jgi:hypothetical protein
MNHMLMHAAPALVGARGPHRQVLIFELTSDA